MRVNVILEMPDESRRGIRARMGQEGLASNADVKSEIFQLWSAHCEDLAIDAQRHDEYELAKSRRDHPAGSSS